MAHRNDTNHQAGRSPTGEDPGRYVLVLYVTGSSPRSIRAILNLNRICEEHLAGRYKLEVVDIFQQPDLAKEARLLAAPTLVKKLPEPIRRVIGDLAAEDRVLVALDIREFEG